MTHDDLARDLQSLREMAREASNAFEDVAAQEHLHRKLTQNLDTIIEALRSFSGEGELARVLMSSRIAEIVHTEAQEYEFRDPDYTPNDSERTMLEDFGFGLLERVAATLTALKTVPDGWRTIDTAPKDGTPIIGAYFNQPWAESHREGRIVKCWYQPEFDSFISGCREMTLARGLTFEDGTSRQLHSPEKQAVTHWMPLPASPIPGEE